MAQHIVTPRSPPHAALQCCPRAWAALVCSALRAPRLQRAGLLGPTPCLSCTLVVADAAARCLAELTQGPASAAACLRAAEEAGRLLDRTNWTGRPSWSDLLNNLRPAQCDLPELGKRCQGWQHHGSRACSSHFRETELLPAPPAPAPLAVGAACCSLAQPPDRMLITLWRRLRLPLLVPYTDAANMATAALLMHMVTTMPPAPAQAFSPAEPNLWSTPGCALLERLSDLRARSSRSNGLHAPWPPTSIPPIAAPRLRSVWGSPARRGLVLRRHTSVSTDTRRAPSAFRRNA